MKTLKEYDGRIVECYQDKDLEKLAKDFEEIQDRWFEIWKSRGSVDDGTCCVGVGLSVNYVPPRGRTPKTKLVVRWEWSQGDLEAQRTKNEILKVCENYGITGVSYEYGRMD